MHQSIDTIVALTTPPGRGGVAVIRISGPMSMSFGLKITKKISIQPRKAYYCAFLDSDDELLDQGIFLYFKAPHSFTGEDIVELHAHGSPIVIDKLLDTCVQMGARLAKPGEFTERAFLNGKIDLTQAEAIADLIHASSQTAARMAIRSLKGEFSNKIKELNKLIIHVRLLVEAAIDFAEEEIEALNHVAISKQLDNILQQINLIISSANQGVMLREGLTIVIAGKPNAGKSTLMNQLSGSEISIVTNEPGTTRDVLRQHILLDDIPLQVIDTAGLRESDSLIEQEGIRRAWQEVKQADCILMLVDISDLEEVDRLEQDIHTAIANNIPLIRVVNKIDQTGICATRQDNTIYISAKMGDGITLLKDAIKTVVGYQPTEGLFMARSRHIHALEAAKEYLLLGYEQWTNYHAGELLAEDLRLAHRALAELTGEFTSDDLLGEIFSSFCIGK